MFLKMEIGEDGCEIAPKQTDKTLVEWRKKAKDKAKLQNRMAAFPGAAVKFPRCRLKLEEAEARKMKERLSNRKHCDLKEEEEQEEKMLGQGDGFPQHDEDVNRKKQLNGKCYIFMRNFRIF